MRTRAGWLGVLVVVLAATARPARSNCDRCEDLCQLMDQYLQKQKTAELFQQYAMSNPARKELPAGVAHDTLGVENQVKAEFNKWAKTRQLPCMPLNGGAGGPEGASTDLETVTQKSTCEIIRNGQPLEGQNLAEYEDAVGCKAISDATIEHEKIHQKHCKATWLEPSTAAAFLDQPENVAESELQAYSHHKDLLAERIRDILYKNGCGWQPTKRQQQDMFALPSLDQVQAMQKQGFRAASALTKYLP